MAGGSTWPARKAASELPETIASILSQAARMSFRYDDSCRINDTRIPENLRANPGFQSAACHEVHLSAHERFQFLGEGFESEDADAHAGLEFDQDVDIAIRRHFPSGCRPEERKLFDSVPATYFGKRWRFDPNVAEMEGLVHVLIHYDSEMADSQGESQKGSCGAHRSERLNHGGFRPKCAFHRSVRGS